RRRPPRHPDDARPRGPFHHADLHARARTAHAQHLRSFSSTAMIGRIFAGLVIVGCAVALTVNLPSKARVVGPMPQDFGPVVRGAIHVHTTRSGGTGTLDDVAAAASKAGLQFVVLSDSGDGSRPPEPPAYRSGVLCIDAVELTTEDGDLVAM